MLLYVTASHPDAERDCLNMVRQNKVDGVIGLTCNPLELDGRSEEACNGQPFTVLTYAYGYPYRRRRMTP